MLSAFPRDPRQLPVMTAAPSATDLPQLSRTPFQESNSASRSTSDSETTSCFSASPGVSLCSSPRPSEFPSTASWFTFAALFPHSSPLDVYSSRYWPAAWAGGSAAPPALPCVQCAYNEPAREIAVTLEDLGRSEVVLRDAGWRADVHVLLILDGWNKAAPCTRKWVKRIFPVSPLPQAMTRNADALVDWQATVASWENSPLKAETLVLQRRFVSPTGPAIGRVIVDVEKTLEGGETLENPDASPDSTAAGLLLTILIKRDNRRKHNSHEWFLHSFAPAYARPIEGPESISGLACSGTGLDIPNLNSFVFLTDSGTRLHATMLSVLLSAALQNTRAVAVTGRQRVMTSDMQFEAEGHQDEDQKEEEEEAGPAETIRRNSSASRLAALQVALSPRKATAVVSARPSEGLIDSFFRAAQKFEYNACVCSFTGAFSIFGMLPVVPGPCGLYRLAYLQTPNAIVQEQRRLLEFLRLLTARGLALKAAWESTTGEFAENLKAAQQKRQQLQSAQDAILDAMALIGGRAAAEANRKNSRWPDDQGNSPEFQECKQPPEETISGRVLLSVELPPSAGFGLGKSDRAGELPGPQGQQRFDHQGALKKHKHADTDGLDNLLIAYGRIVAGFGIFLALLHRRYRREIRRQDSDYHQENPPLFFTPEVLDVVQQKLQRISARIAQVSLCLSGLKDSEGPDKAAGAAVAGLMEMILTKLNTIQNLLEHCDLSGIAPLAAASLNSKCSWVLPNDPLSGEAGAPPVNSSSELIGRLRRSADPLELYFNCVNTGPERLDGDLSFLFSALLLAEDRILSDAAVLKCSRPVDAESIFAPNAVYWVQGECDSEKFIQQRRRWTNGGLSAYVALLIFQWNDVYNKPGAVAQDWTRFFRISAANTIWIRYALFIAQLSQMFVVAHAPCLMILALKLALGYFPDSPIHDWLLIGYFLYFTLFMGVHARSSPTAERLNWPLWYFGIFINAIVMCVTNVTLWLFVYRHVAEATETGDYTGAKFLVSVMVLCASLSPFVMALITDLYFFLPAILYPAQRQHFLSIKFLSSWKFSIIYQHSAFFSMILTLIPFYLFLPSLAGLIHLYSYCRFHETSWGNRPEDRIVDLSERNRLERARKGLLSRSALIAGFLWGSNGFFLLLAIRFHSEESFLIGLSLFVLGWYTFRMLISFSWLMGKFFGDPIYGLGNAWKRSRKIHREEKERLKEEQTFMTIENGGNAAATGVGDASGAPINNA